MKKILILGSFFAVFSLNAMIFEDNYTTVNVNYVNKSSTEIHYNGFIIPPNQSSQHEIFAEFPLYRGAETIYIAPNSNEQAPYWKRQFEVILNSTPLSRSSLEFSDGMNEPSRIVINNMEHENFLDFHVTQSQHIRAHMYKDNDNNATCVFTDLNINKNNETAAILNSLLQL